MARLVLDPRHRVQPSRLSDFEDGTEEGGKETRKKRHVGSWWRQKNTSARGFFGTSGGRPSAATIYSTKSGRNVHPHECVCISAPPQTSLSFLAPAKSDSGLIYLATGGKKVPLNSRSRYREMFDVPGTII